MADGAHCSSELGRCPSDRVRRGHGCRAIWEGYKRYARTRDQHCTRAAQRSIVGVRDRNLVHANSARVNGCVELVNHLPLAL
jgi:hypothetical protein